MDISEKQKQKIEGLAKKYSLKLILLFGSRATDRSRKESDYDIAYLPAKNLGYDDEIDINSKFISIFPHEQGRIDTVDIRRANPLLIFQISKKNILLFGNREEFVKFKLRAFKKYNDYAPYFEMEKKVNKRIIKEYAN
ncbi:MAG: nucleotidyltransferase domain-containing protein [bacterium]